MSKTNMQPSEEEIAIIHIDHHWEYIVDDEDERNACFDQIGDEILVSREQLEVVFQAQKTKRAKVLNSLADDNIRILNVEIYQILIDIKEKVFDYRKLENPNFAHVTDLKYLKRSLEEVRDLKPFNQDKFNKVTERLNNG